MSSVKLHGIAALLVLIIVALGVIVAAIASDAVPREEDAQEVVTDSTVLVEGRASCPFCGAETWAINGEIACRNEECAAYGLPVEVHRIGSASSAGTAS